MAFKEFIDSRATSLLSVLGVALPFKEAFGDHWTENNVNEVNSAAVTEGEVWEINNIYFITSSPADTLALVAYTCDDTIFFDRLEDTNTLIYHHSVFLNEGDFLGARAAIQANLALYILGIKRYSIDALEDLLHKVRPIPLRENVQSAKPRPDPVM